MKVYKEEIGLPIKGWLDDLEEKALDQAYNVARLPFATKHVALMPDAHPGFGVPIGTVFATKGVVICNAVGVDIGCGVTAVRTELTEISNEDLRKKCMRPIRKAIPVGKARHRDPEPEDYMPDRWGEEKQELLAGEVVNREFEKARKQLGTLGGGNHFIEIQKGSDGHIWLTVHSGSRNIGKQVADHYNKIAKELNALWFSSVPAKADLAFLPLSTPEGKAYMREMKWCVEFAKKNRALMINRALSGMQAAGVNAMRVKWYDIPHNYAALENHFGENVVVHRKGATRAYKGEYGLIPGSQGAKSYFVRGKGNELSFKSCSHGAGRQMGRKEAIRSLDFEEQKKLLDDLGVIHSVRSAADLDEAPAAYKDIEKVMADQTDLVDIEIEFTPLAVIKG